MTITRKLTAGALLATAGSGVAAAGTSRGVWAEQDRLGEVTERIHALVR